MNTFELISDQLTEIDASDAILAVYAMILRTKLPSSTDSQWNQVRDALQLARDLAVHCEESDNRAAQKLTEAA